jgi:hypothetical protein
VVGAWRNETDSCHHGRLQALPSRHSRMESRMSRSDCFFIVVRIHCLQGASC